MEGQKGNKWEHDTFGELQVVWGLRCRGWGMEWDEVGKCPIVKIIVTKLKNVDFILRGMEIHWMIKCVFWKHHFPQQYGDSIWK